MSKQIDPYESKVLEALSVAIRKIREARGLTRAHAALALGSKIRTIQAYEEGTRRVSVADLLRLCAAYTVSPEAVLLQLPQPPRILPLATLESGAVRRQKHK